MTSLIKLCVCIYSLFATAYFMPIAFAADISPLEVHGSNKITISPLNSIHPVRATLDKLTITAITLQQGNSWSIDAGKQARAKLVDDKIALRELDGLHKLLDNDLVGITDIFSHHGDEPSLAEVQGAEKSLRDGECKIVCALAS
jgi:hypothetical protein